MATDPCVSPVSLRHHDLEVLLAGRRDEKPLEGDPQAVGGPVGPRAGPHHARPAPVAAREEDHRLVRIGREHAARGHDRVLEAEGERSRGRRPFATRPATGHDRECRGRSEIDVAREDLHSLPSECPRDGVLSRSRYHREGRLRQYSAGNEGAMRPVTRRCGAWAARRHRVVPVRAAVGPPGSFEGADSAFTVRSSRLHIGSVRLRRTS